MKNSNGKERKIDRKYCCEKNLLVLDLVINCVFLLKSKYFVERFYSFYSEGVSKNTNDTLCSSSFNIYFNQSSIVKIQFPTIIKALLTFYKEVPVKRWIYSDQSKIFPLFMRDPVRRCR